jgi:hypothetical protein
LAFGIGSTKPNMLTEAIFYASFAIVSLLPMGYAFMKYVKEFVHRPSYLHCWLPFREEVVDLFENERLSIKAQDEQVISASATLKNESKDEVVVSVSEKWCSYGRKLYS